MKRLLLIFEQDKKLMIKVIAGVILLVAAFSFYLIKEISADNDISMSEIPEIETESVEVTTETSIEENTAVVVDVSGAVVNPSVVELPNGSRVYQAIQKAGGLTEAADTRSTNQAEILTDGQKVYIPTKQELEGTDNKSSGTASFSSPFQSGSGSSGLININTADSAALQELTGVGPSTAEKIINYRNENGKFDRIEDIKNVSGIGNKTFEKFKNKITV